MKLESSHFCCSYMATFFTTHFIPSLSSTLLLMASSSLLLRLVAIWHHNCKKFLVLQDAVLRKPLLVTSTLVLFTISWVLFIFLSRTLIDKCFYKLSKANKRLLKGRHESNSSHSHAPNDNQQKHQYHIILNIISYHIKYGAYCK